jgi:cytochrome c biogenesis protein
MDRLHALYDPTLGPDLVSLLERLQLFHVFSSTWFSVGLVVLIVSIVACTIDRTPRLWRQSAEIRVVQPEPFYDPKLPDRALMAGVDADAAAAVLRRHRFAVRREDSDGVTYLYGDRNRWTKMATLLTHTGLVLFLLAAWITANFGFEQGLVVAEGESLTVQPIGTPGLLLVRNLGFEAPGFETGAPTDFTTRLAVYQDGDQIAEKTIRVNDPLEVAGYTFHQNGFGPAPDVVIRDRAGKPLWTGPIPMTDVAAGLPFAEFAVPGRDVALQLLLQRASDGMGVLLVLPFHAVGENPDGTPVIEGLEPIVLTRGQTDTADGTDFSIELRSFSEFTLLIAKRDPGAGVVWTAFGFLIVGLLITFWMPRRRVWGRLDADGRLALVVRADRYVDVGREFGRVLDDLVAARRS